MGPEILFPAAAYVAMAIEAMFQSSQSTNPNEGVSSLDQLRYRLRNVKFDRALVLEENRPAKVMLTLTPHSGVKDSWFDFKVSSLREEVRSEHCYGLIRLEKVIAEGRINIFLMLVGANKASVASEADLVQLKHSTPGHLWYKAMADAGYGFGPFFQTQLEVESTSGMRQSRSLVSLVEPPSTWSPQSSYPMHPACIDGCVQTVTPSLVAENRSGINAVLVPTVIDDLVINPITTRPETGISVATSEYVGKGRHGTIRTICRDVRYTI